MIIHTRQLVKWFVARLVCYATVVSVVVLFAAASLGQTSAPTVVSSVGYLNGTPQASHTTATFNSGGAATLVAFVSSYPAWPWPGGATVSISGLSDSAGNTWNLLSGPMTWPGSSYTQLSAIYYVNAPLTSATHTVTVQLTNPVPLVVHIFAVSGSDINGPPLYSAITDPGPGGSSASVASTPISVGANSLLLGWVKNETAGTATAANGFTLDAQQSTSYLWAEAQTAFTAGSYSSQFQYDQAIGWQTAIVGLQPSTRPQSFSQSVTTGQNTPAAITLTATSASGFQLTFTTLTGPAHGALTGTAPDLTYTPNAGFFGSDSFTFKANDTTADSNIATVNIIVVGSVPAVVSSLGYINGTPLTTHTTATFNSGGASALVAFVSSHPAWPWPGGLPVSITGVSDNVGNAWNLLTGPTTWAGSSLTLMSAIYYMNAPITSAAHTISIELTNPAPLVFHVFAVSNSDTTAPPVYSAITGPVPGGTSASVMSAPVSVGAAALLLGWVKNESAGTATAVDGFTLDPRSTSYLWAETQTSLTAGSYGAQFQYDSAIGWQTATVALSVANATVSVPSFTVTPANPTNQGSASFGFTDNEAGVSFLCQLDGGGFGTCSSPMFYAGPLTQGSHSFAVEAQDGGGNRSSAASFTWTINTTPPTAPMIISAPTNPSNQNSASFSFTDTQTGVTFLCQLDGSVFSACAGSASYSSLGQGSHVFAVEAQDAAGNQSAATTFSWTINTMGPVAFNQVVKTQQNTPVAITLTGTSPNGFQLTYTTLAGPTQGALTGTAPNLTYTPNAGYIGSDSFTFKVNDTTADSNVATVSITVLGPTPAVVSSVGYDDSTPQTTHTTATFNSSGASTLVAFVGSHPAWPWPDGAPVSITGVSDSAGNTWTLLTGPTTWIGNTFGLISAVYYVNAPITSPTHSVTVQLTNSAPLVVHTFAVAGSSTNGLPIYSGITDPGPGGSSTSVASAPISVGENTLLLGWVKNETSATATAVNGYTLDPQSTPFLWAESQPVLSAGSYTDQFQFNQAVGWETAIVGLSPANSAVPIPSVIAMPSNPTNQTSASLSFSDTEAGVSFLCQLDGSPFSTCVSPATYSGLTQGSHTFAVEAQDAIGNQSAAASYSWAIITTPPPAPAIGSTPANPTNQTGASFGFSDTQTGVSFLCQLDGSSFSACASPKTYSALTQGSHAFAVEAQDAAGNQSAATSFTWSIITTPPPTPSIGSTPANPTNQTGASFGFSDTQTGVSFVCQLDGSSFGACASPKAYSSLTQGSHTFAVEAQDPAGNQSAAASFTWSIITTPPPAPAISSTPANPTNQTGASFGFSDTQTGVSFLCQLDGSTFSTCASPKAYSSLTQGSHTFAVEAQDPAGNQSTPTSFTWSTITTPPPAPAIGSTPANPTNKTSASFSFTDTQGGVTFQCQLDGSAFSSCTSPQGYSGLSQASHTFSVKAQDAAGNQSGATSFTWTIDTTPPPAPTITSTPANPTNHTSASFSFTDTQGGVTFLCQLDGGAFSTCTSPKGYSGLSQASHTFSVKGQDAAHNQSGAASFTWTIITTPPPPPAITSTPANPTNHTSASFSFTDTEGSVTYLCQLDAGAFSTCTSPKAYSGLSQTSHTFSVKAQDTARNQSGAASFTWTVDTTPPPTPSIISSPANPTNQTTAGFSFTDTEGGVTYLCQIDGSTFSSCSSPQAFSGLSQATHRFSVKAQDAAGNQSGATRFTWTVYTTPPPAPTITSKPAKLTLRTSASFSFTDTQTSVSFLCQLDSGTFSACSSPKSYSGLSLGNHTFSVKAQDAAGNQSGAAAFTWTIT